MSVPSRIVFIESSEKMAGVEYSTLYLARVLASKKWLPLVISPGEGDLPNACRLSEVPVRILPLPALMATSIRVALRSDRRVPNPAAWIWNVGAVLVASRRLKELLQRENPALVITKGMSAHLYGGIASRWARIPCLWHLQDFITERYWGIYRRIFGLLAQTIPTWLVADGTPISDQLPSHVRRRLSIVLNGVDTDLFKPGANGGVVRSELMIPDNALVIGNVARLTPWKGQHFLLEAFSRVAGMAPRPYLLLVGSGLFENDDYEQQLRRRAKELGLEKQVVFAGYRKDLPDVLAAMNVFAYSSVEKDTSPLSLLSAMASGLPVVAFDIPGIREVVKDHGLLVPVGQDDKLAAALMILLSDERERKRIAVEARERAVSAFSLEAHARAMEAAFEDCVKVGCG